MSTPRLSKDGTHGGDEGGHKWLNSWKRRKRKTKPYGLKAKV
jgi:hypothetical protein